ncbi:putative phospholipase B-like 2 isoform X2 [Hydra vulgaris]|uniref:Phospholipase B-like n=1 Tax=Hydra vulgaris TaxID=6087 RepID=A0ABM4CQP3_HYDVU
MYFKFFAAVYSVIFGVFGNPNLLLEKHRYISVVLDQKSNTLVIKNYTSEDYVAKAAFKNSMNESGWSKLYVSTNGKYSDILQAEAAGMAEGFLTSDQISMNYMNTLNDYCVNEKEYCKKLEDFLNENSKWMSQQLEIKENAKSSYWQQVVLVNKQLEGLLNGYLESKTEPSLTLLNVRMLQLYGDLFDLEKRLGKKSLKKFGSCSALVKLFPNNSDLAISHVTWFSYNTMLRIFKYYNFTFHDEQGNLIPGNEQSFASYPGSLLSLDDFYILSSGLVTQETSINNDNDNLWEYVQPSSLFEWVRNIVANRLASTASEWCYLFKRYNSGTYNNQWMVINYNLFEPGKHIKPDTFWVLEQLPGIVEMADMSIFLQENGYWASYNIPYFPYIYNISGYMDSLKKFGDFFDYNLNPRAQIFKRDHMKVSNMQSLIKLMRYNDFQNDPFAKCNCTPSHNAANAISSRNDLNPANGSYPFSDLIHDKFGAIDCKATSFQLSKFMSQFIVGGPTYDQQTPFQWSKTEWNRPLGHPDIFKFKPELLDWRKEEWIYSKLNI